jgi:hypothetical protein
MASPVVSGTIALMLQANPALTPNLVKAVLQYTAEDRAGYDAFTQGAGFLNARGAVELAAALAGGRTIASSQLGDPTPWSGRLVWGNLTVAGGRLTPMASAWRPGVAWGDATAADGGAITWGVIEATDEQLPGGALVPAAPGTFVPWSAPAGRRQVTR